MIKRVLVSIVSSVLIITAAIVGFVVIPNSLDKFRAATPMTNNEITSVSGNGTAAVMVGEYLYFVNGYVDTANSAEYGYKQNVYNAPKNAGDGGIWRVRMAYNNTKRESTPVYDNDYMYDFDENGDWNEYKDLDRFDDEQKYGFSGENDLMNQYIKAGRNNYELVVPKIAGFSKTALWVFDNTLIYVTPADAKDSSGTFLRDNIEFYACNLNGTNNRRIYAATNTDPEFTVAYDGKPYLLIRDGANKEKLYRVSMSGSATLITDRCASAVFPQVTNYYDANHSQHTDETQCGESSLSKSYSGVMNYVFYTESPNDDEREEGVSTIFKRFKLNSASKNDVEELWRDHPTSWDSIAITFYALADGCLMFETKNNTGLVKLHAISSTDKASYQPGNLLAVDQVCLSRDPNGTLEETLYLANERTFGLGSSNFKYFTIHAGTLYMHSLTNAYEKIITTDVSKIMSIGASDIVYANSIGSYTVIKDYRGAATVKQVMLSGTPIDGAPITTFNVLDNTGISTGEIMFFYIQTKSEILAEGSTKTPKSIDVATIIDTQSHDYILARLAKRYIHSN